MDESILSKWLSENYKFKSLPHVKLLRSYTNDVYEIVAGNKYIFKIYGKGWRTSEEINWEVELLEYLSKKGLVVSKAILDNKNTSVGKIDERFCVLFEFALGKKPEKPFTLDLYFLFGQEIGKMHALSTDFKSSYKRKDIDIKYLIDDPVELASSFLSEDSLEKRILKEVTQKVSFKINSVKDKLDCGPIHGDATLDNLHITEENNVILYDFDSGGMGWRASDLQGWAYGQEEYREKYESFLSGYRSANKLNNLDIEISPYLTIAWEIWGLEVDLKNRIIKLGKEEIQKYLVKQIESIKKMYERLE